MTFPMSPNDDSYKCPRSVTRSWPREAWIAMVAASMRAEDDDPDSEPWH